MYNSCEENDIIQCPYNKYHVISLLRFSRHLVKCEKSYPNNLKVICPYNATHRFNKSDIGNHIKQCPARTTVEEYYLFQSNNQNRNDRKLAQQSCKTESDDNLEDPEAFESSLSYALENVLSLEKDKKFDDTQDNQSKFKPMVPIEPLSDEEERICDRKTTRQRMNGDYNDFLDESFPREMSMVGRRAIGRGKTSNYSASDISVGEESLVGLQAIGRGWPIPNYAERFPRASLKMKGGKTGGRVPKII